MNKLQIKSNLVLHRSGCLSPIHTSFTAETVISLLAIASMFCRIEPTSIFTHERTREVFSYDIGKTAFDVVTASRFHDSILNSAGAISVISNRHCARFLRISKVERQYTADYHYERENQFCRRHC